MAELACAMLRACSEDCLGILLDPHAGDVMRFLACQLRAALHMVAEGGDE